MISEEDLYELVNPQIKKLVFSKFRKYAEDDLTACFQELLKFLYLSSKYPQLKGKFIPITQKVDELWHYIILQTAYYQKLCSQLPGGKIIHHKSLSFSEYKKTMEKKNLIEEILRWISLYVKNFGFLKEERLKYWFFMTVVKQTLNIPLSEINKIAQNDTYFLDKNDSPSKHERLQWKRWASLSSEGQLNINTNARSLPMAHSDGTGEELVALNQFGADIIHFAAGKGVKKHVHAGDHILFVIHGSGTVSFYDEIYELAAGICYLIPGNAPHAIDARSDLVLIAVANHRFSVESFERMELIEK